MRSRTTLFTSVLALVVTYVPANAQQTVEVTSCGQVVPDRTTGYLSADLDCTGFVGGIGVEPGAAVTLGRASVLDLRGFTLTAGQHGVLCNNLPDFNRARCTVFGGAIAGTAGKCIAGHKLIVHDVAVTGCNQGLHGYRRVKLTDSSVTGATYSGVLSGVARVSSSAVTGNGEFGISASLTKNARAKILDSTITGNSLWDQCGTLPCGDIFSTKRPVVRNTICDVSVAPTFESETDWGVCSAD